MKIFNIKMTAIAALLTLGSQAALAEESAATWLAEGKAEIQKQKRLFPNARRAKNVILFIGDGMGVSTVTGARIFEGQQKGGDGERNQLSFEKFPYIALSKTYSANQQTPDSAPTMTAMVGGVKTNDGMIGISQNVSRKESDWNVVQANLVTSFLEQAESSGKSTGVVSTARLTHATPAACYAHSADRNWEGNADLPAEAVATGTLDIAAQLIDNFGQGKIGDGIEVAMGGGRRYFLPETVTDSEGSNGRRTDGRNLTTEFTTKFGGVYVENKTGFDAVNTETTTKLLGLFESSHMEYEQDRAGDTGGEPSIAEMTTKAIDILNNNDKGFFLMVEAGRIDHASHAGNAFRTFKDTVAFSDAIQAAVDKVDLNDTLIIVSADHSHTLTIGGYPRRGNDIMGLVVPAGGADGAYSLAEDGNPFTTLTFANGRGYHVGVAGDDVYGEAVQAGRIEDMTNVNTADPDFHQEALIPSSSETHSGEDVAIYAIGPKAYLMRGVQEQSYIYQVMREAFGY